MPPSRSSTSTGSRMAGCSCWRARPVPVRAPSSTRSRLPCTGAWPGRIRRSSEDLRRGLLPKLFGTSLYDRITEDLCARRTEATRARDQAGRAISIAVSAAAEAAGLDAIESAELLAAARAERQTQLKELDESLAQAIAATGPALAAAAGSLSAAQAEEEEARRQ